MSLRKSRHPHHIAHAAHCMNEFRFAGIQLQPQQVYKGFNRISRNFAVEPPNRFQNCVAGNHPSMVSHQQFEKTEFARRQAHRISAASHAAGGGIQLQIGNLQAHGPRNRAPPADGSQPGKQYVKKKTVWSNSRPHLSPVRQ